jgi:Ca2+-binding RTX toxin-like protein
MDFATGDKIMVAGAAGDYFFRENQSRDGFTGTAVFHDTNRSGTYDKFDEMVALVVNASAAPLLQSVIVVSTASEPLPEDPLLPAGDLILGTLGNDSLAGGEGADTLVGVTGDDPRLGGNQLDELTGGAGNDFFVLGDHRGVFYDDGKLDTAGMNNYARIMDFNAGDRIVAAGVSGNYFFRDDFTRDGFTGTAIFHDSNGSGGYDKYDEMIALVANAAPGAVTVADFLFV